MALALRPRHRDTSRTTVVSGYRRQARLKLLIIAGLVVLVLVLAVVGIVVGASHFTVGEGARALGRLLWPRATDTGLVDDIVWKLRIPRVLMGIAGGLALAVAGLIMQTILRNPLASPYTLGISSAASFGAALAILVKTSVVSLIPLPYDSVIIVNAFFFSLVSTVAVYALTRLQQVTAETIVLLGIAMMFMFQAFTSLVQYLGDPDRLAELTYWMFGSLNSSTWTMVGIVSTIAVLGAVIAYRWVWDLNALLADDESAATAGINVGRVRLKAMVLAALLTATVVSFLGPIGFVGLVAPHCARMIVGGDHRFLFPITVVLGAGLLLGADIIARTIAAPVVIPVGIITAFVGVPVLIFLMLRRRGEQW